MQYRHYHYTYIERGTRKRRTGVVRATSLKDAYNRFNAVKASCLAPGTEPIIEHLTNENKVQSRCKT